MSNLFEELMQQNRTLTEGVHKSRKTGPVVESKKISCGKIKLESRRIFESEDLDSLDDQFAVGTTEDSAEDNADEVVLVIDPEAPADEEVPENAAEEMIGDSVYKCPICGVNYVCDCDAQNESLEVDENGVPTECPICGESEAEQILIGEIAPVEGAGEETTLDPQENEEVVEDELPSEEEVAEDELPEEEEEEEVITDSLKPMTEDFEVGVEEEEEDDITPPDEICTGLELVTPEDDEPVEPAVNINAQVVNLDLDDKRFESMMTQMIRENYRFDPTFKITKATSNKGLLKLEYVVRDSRSKKMIKGILVAEGFSRDSRKMTLKFKDKGAFTESFAKEPSFVVECVRIRNKIIPTAMTYDFTKRINESLYRVSGSVDSRKK